MSDFRIEKRDALSAAGLRGLRLSGVQCLDQDLTLQGHKSSGWILGWLRLAFEGGQHLLLSVRSTELDTDRGVVELFIPELETASELPGLPRWPGGPLRKWVHAGELESGTAGHVLEDIKILSMLFDGTTRFDSGIFLQLSGPESLAVLCNAALPLTFIVSRIAPGELRWDGYIRSVAAANLDLIR